MKTLMFKIGTNLQKYIFFEQPDNKASCSNNLVLMLVLKQTPRHKVNVFG